MSATPSELHTFANVIRKMLSDEASYRGCISRYYYSAYHAAKEFHDSLSKPGKSQANVGEHMNLIHMLDNPNINTDSPEYLTSKELAIYLKKILFNRRVADYQLDQPITIKNVELVENEVSLIFQSV